MGGQLRSTLLGVLLARANRPVPVSALADAMWNDAVDDRTPQKLHLHVHKLRRFLDDPDRVSSSAGGYQLRVLPGELDAERFESLADEAAARVAADPPE
nr:helix-turn-helix domain-containing protein [Kibdelosporangium phytohabitans]